MNFKMKFFFQILLLETLFSGFHFKKQSTIFKKCFIIFRSFAHRLDQSLHIWNIALSGP